MLGPPEKVLAFAGGDVILPCSFKITARGGFPTVEWSKEGLQPDHIVFLYRNGCEDHAMKNPAFRYRTSFISKELQKGNISLRITGVKLSDAGKYQCKRLRGKAPHDVTAVELVVGAVSEPKLSVMSAEDGGVTLHCEANCWLPEPEIVFLDDQGKNIPADDPKRDEDARGCFTVRRRATLQDATNSVTCRVHQPETNQTRDTKMNIPGRSCSLTTVSAVGGTMLLLLVLSCGLNVFLWKRHGKSVTRQSSDQSSVSGTYEDELLLRSVRVDRSDYMENEMLRKEVADLNSKLHEKEETIRQLQDNNKPELNAVVNQHHQPTIHCSPAASTSGGPQKSHSAPQNRGRKPGIVQQNSFPVPRPLINRVRVCSCPPLLNSPVSSSCSSASTSRKTIGRIGRSMSDTRPSPKAKLKRRHSSVFLSSDNTFMPLTDLAEE